MTIAQPIPTLTFEEYLTYSDGTDTRYELINGTLVAMTLGTGEHGAIADFLSRTLQIQADRDGHSWVAKYMIIGVRSPRLSRGVPRWDTSRIPDVVVIPKAQWQELRQREAVIDLTEPPPLLVVEVVSESTKTADYRTKYTEYCLLDIPEYWIVDPIARQMTICVLNQGRYDDRVFTGSDRLQSPTFPNLALTVEQVLSAD